MRAEEKVYSPASQLSRPGLLLRQMLRDLNNAKYLGWRILVRDLSARHRQTLLGYVWIIIPPMAVALGLTLATRSQVIRIESTNIPYPAYVVFSMSLWQTFAEAVTATSVLISRSNSILSRIYFPREALILAGLGDVCINFIVRLLLVFLVFIGFGVPVSTATLAAVPAAAVMVMLGFAFGLFIAPFAALYHDLIRGIAIGLMVWLFFSPVLYPVPRGEGLFASLVSINPVTPVLVTARELASGAPLTMLPYFSLVSVLAIVGLCISWVVCRLSLPFVIERLRA